MLDLYAGSGAVGLEALSRGAADVVLVEADRAAAQVIRGNIETRGPARRAVAARARRAGAGPRAGGRAAPRDFVFADPPYATSADEVTQVLELLLDRGWLAPGALVVVERATRSGAARLAARIPAGQGPRRYGEATLWYGLAAGAAVCR